MPRVATNPDVRETIKSLEEQLEYSTVTSSRQQLLPMIQRLQKTPALRFLIVKHGAPQAVLMSYPTYEALKRVAVLFIKQTDALSEEEQVEAALDEFRNEEEPAAPQASAAAAGSTVKEAKVVLDQLQAAIQSADEQLRTIRQSAAFEQRSQPAKVARAHPMRKVNC